MARWLFKTEPSEYGWDDLVKDKRAVWDGVSNALALKHLREVKKGDEVIIYHTGDERAAVGLAEVTKGPFLDPKEKDEKLVVVEIKPRRKFARTASLVEFKEDPAFAGWDLLRLGRLSIVLVPEAIWKRLEQLVDSKQ